MAIDWEKNNKLSNTGVIMLYLVAFIVSVAFVTVLAHKYIPEKSSVYDEILKYHSEGTCYEFSYIINSVYDNQELYYYNRTTSLPLFIKKINIMSDTGRRLDYANVTFKVVDCGVDD